jgi:hypothetical protein
MRDEVEAERARRGTRGCVVVVLGVVEVDTPAAGEGEGEGIGEGSEDGDAKDRDNEGRDGREAEDKSGADSRR